MATAQLLTLTHGVDDKVKGVDGKVTRINDEVKGMGGKVNEIGDTVRLVHEGAQCIMFSCAFLRKRLCEQMEKRPKQSFNLWQTTVKQRVRPSQ